MSFSHFLSSVSSSTINYFLLKSFAFPDNVSFSFPQNSLICSFSVPFFDFSPTWLLIIERCAKIFFLSFLPSMHPLSMTQHSSVTQHDQFYANDFQVLFCKFKPSPTKSVICVFSLKRKQTHLLFLNLANDNASTLIIQTINNKVIFS